MTSVGLGARAQRIVSLDNEFYIPIGSLTNLVYALNTTTNQLTTASWATYGSRYLSSVQTAGGLLRDHGKTYLSGGRTFRKIQVVVPQSTGTLTSTFGVGGASGTTPNVDYLTGYIEIGFDAASGTAPTPVAKWGR